jgi:hypothetical protein
VTVGPGQAALKQQQLWVLLQWTQQHLRLLLLLLMLPLVLLLLLLC